MIGSVINRFSAAFHSPQSSKFHYESVVQVREDGKPNHPPISSKGIKLKNKIKQEESRSRDRKIRGQTAAMFQQDNNQSQSKHFKYIFDHLLEITPRKEERQNMQHQPLK